MTEKRFRGLFWCDPDRRIPGYFTWTDGELSVELHGTLLAPSVPWHGAREIERLDGEIANSPFAGPAISLFRCLRIQQSFGTGGPTERWIAHRGLAGSDLHDEKPQFPRVTLTVHGLKAFLGAPPALVEFENRTADFSEPLIETARARSDGWEVLFGWRTAGKWSDDHIAIERVPVVEVVLAQPATPEEILQDVLKPFELLLTVACRSYAPIKTVRLGSAAALPESYDLLYPRVATDEARREPHRFDLLLRLADFAEPSLVVSRLRRLLREQRDFCAVFLGHERAPSRFIEDRVRGSLLAFGLLGLGDADCARTAQATIGHARAAATDPFVLGSAGTAAIPLFARKLLSGSVPEALGIDADNFMSRVGHAYRWTMLRDGEPCDVRDLLTTRDEVRTLTYLVLLQSLGLEPSEALERIGRVAREGR